MKVAYARVSTLDQNTDMQIDAFKEAGCERIFEEKESGGKDSRQVLKEVLEFLRPGDTLVVWDIKRFARSTRFLMNTLHDLTERGVWFESISEPFLNTSGKDDYFKKFLRALFAAMAELDLDIIRERIREGKKAARARGRSGGRPKHPVLGNSKSLAIVMDTYDKGDITVEQLCKTFNIASQNTFYLYRRQWLKQKEGPVSETPTA